MIREIKLGVDLIDENSKPCKIDPLKNDYIVDFIEDHIDLFFPNTPCFALEWKELKGLKITNDNHQWNPEYLKVVFNNGSELFCDISAFGAFQYTTIEISRFCNIQNIT